MHRWHITVVGRLNIYYQPGHFWTKLFNKLQSNKYLLNNDTIPQAYYWTGDNWPIVNWTIVNWPILLFNCSLFNQYVVQSCHLVNCFNYFMSLKDVIISSCPHNFHPFFQTTAENSVSAKRSPSPKWEMIIFIPDPNHK